jgi:hypothetical protein
LSQLCSPRLLVLAPNTVPAANLTTTMSEIERPLALSGFERAAAQFVVAALLGVMALAGTLFQYAHPQIDDLFRASRVRDHGVFTSIAMEYLTWSGRWLGTGISYALSAHIDLRHHYPSALWTVFLASLLGTYLLVRGVLTVQLPQRCALALSLALVVLSWAGTVDPGDSYYWFTGAIENNLSITIAMAIVGWLLSMPVRKGTSLARALRLGALAVIALLLPGIHELYGAILCLILALGVVIGHRTRDPKQVEWWVAAVACLAGVAIVTAAPGNAVRVSQTHVHRSIFTILRLVHLVPVTAGWIVSPRLLTASAAFAFNPSIRRLRPAWTRSSVPWRWVVPCATAAVAIVAFGACYWLAGAVPSRTLAALYRVFLIGWFVTLFAWTRFRDSGPEGVPSLERWWGVSSLGFGAALLLSSNSLTALQDLRWRAPAYDRAFRRRDAFIERAEARGDRHVGVASLSPEPLLFLHADLVNDPRHYQNWGPLLFYGLASIRVDPSLVSQEASPPVVLARHLGDGAARISLLGRQETELNGLGEPLPWSGSRGARRMVAPEARVGFSAPPNETRAVIELRALSLAPGHVLEARVNDESVAAQPFLVPGEWHAFLSRPFRLQPGPNQLVLREATAGSRGSAEPAILMDEVTLAPE